MRKIIFISANSLRRYGGGEKWLINIGNLLKDRGYDVNIIALSRAPEIRISLEDLNRKIKFNYEEINYNKKIILLIDLKITSNADSDIIYTPSAYYYFVKKILSLKGTKIWGFHNPKLINPEGFFDKRLIKKLIPKFDKIHLLNNSQINVIKNKNIFLLENTFLGEISERKNKFDKFTVIFFGRHEEDKGVETVRYVAERLPNEIDLLIAGEGSKSYLLKEIKKDNVKFLGFIDDELLMDYVARSHLMLFPSYKESSSYAILESLANSTPIIYRPIPENNLISKIKFNIVARSDEDFLKGIIYKYNEYKENEEEYLENCYKLPSYLMPRDEYIEKFENYFLK
jgi:glycosyltransferase involved in cell wall biosynthesis